MSEPIDHVPAIPELNVSGARHLAEFGEDESSWLSRKCQAQKEQITLLLAALKASKQADLAARCIRQEAQLSRIQHILERRERLYVKGYEKGYMDALKRHGLDMP